MHSPPPSLSSRQHKSGLAIIFLTIFIDLIGFGIVIPLIPTYVRAMDSPPSVVGFVLASFTLMQFLFNPIWGRLSDRYGRRPFILLGLLGSFGSYLLFAFAADLWMLLASRLLAGLFNANVAVGQAYVADITPPERRARGMGLIGAAFGLGFTFGPALGGVAGWFGETWLGTVWGFRLPGLVAAGFSLFAFVWAYFRLVESHPVEQRSQAPKNGREFNLRRLGQALRQPMILGLLVLFFLEVFSFANFESSYVLFVDERWAFNKLWIGLSIGVLGLLSAAIQGGLIGRLSARFGEAALLKAGLFFLALGLGIFPFTPSGFMVFLTLAPIAIGIGLINPTIPTLISRVCRPEERGGVMGLAQSMGSLGRILGQPFGTVAFQYVGQGAPFHAGGLVMLLAFCAALPFIRQPEVGQVN